jgi:hypothetical protein
MRETKCDLCRKKIKGEPVTAGVGFFPKAELCEKCGQPILKFLKRNKFIEDKKIKQK